MQDPAGLTFRLSFICRSFVDSVGKVNQSGAYCIIKSSARHYPFGYFSRRRRGTSAAETKNGARGKPCAEGGIKYAHSIAFRPGGFYSFANQLFIQLRNTAAF
jgi:hypothetical protein